MRTIEEIKANCDIESYEQRGSNKEHWFWRGAIKKGMGTPVCQAPDYTKSPDGTMTVQNVRRAIRHISTKKPIPRGLGGYSSCWNEDYVSPDCTVWKTKAQYGAFYSRQGHDRNNPKRQVASRKRWAGRRKLSDELAGWIMEDPRPARAVAQSLGLHPSTITRTRRGERVGDAVPIFAGLFTGLLR